MYSQLVNWLPPTYAGQAMVGVEHLRLALAQGLLQSLPQTPIEGCWTAAIDSRVPLCAVGRRFGKLDIGSCPSLTNSTSAEKMPLSSEVLV